MGPPSNGRAPAAEMTGAPCHRVLRERADTAPAGPPAGEADSAAHGEAFDGPPAPVEWRKEVTNARLRACINFGGIVEYVFNS